MSDKKIYELDESTSPGLTSEVPVSTGTGVNDTKRVKLSNLGFSEFFYTAATPTATTSRALWINSTTFEMKVWNGSTWVSSNYCLKADTIPLASLSSQAQATIMGRASGAGTGSVTALTAAEVLTLLGVAAGANNYTHPNHTGDVTSTGDGATVIATNAVETAMIADASGAADGVTNAKLAWMGANTIKANPTASTAVPSNISLAANQILGRSSSGNIAAKTVTDFGYSLIDDATKYAAHTTLGIEGTEHCLGYTELCNFDSTGDQLITLEAGKKIITRIIVTEGTVSMTTAAGGIYEGVGKSGNVIVAASQTYTNLGGSASDIEQLTLAAYAQGNYTTATSIYLSLTTPQGSTCSASVFVFGYQLPV